MKEYKFRALRTDKDEFVYGHYLVMTAAQLVLDVPLAECRRCFLILDEDGVHFHTKNETVGQFTGLKDRNGADIYEGDIVRWSVNEVAPVGVVTYSCGWYDLESPCAAFPSIGWDFLRGESEVIGNIHKNPELVK